MDVIAILPHLWIVPLASAFVAGLGFLWWFGLGKWFADDYARRYPKEISMNGWKFVAIVWWMFAGIGFIVSVLLLIPFDSKYHVFFRLEGTAHVETNSFENGTGDLSYTPVLFIDGYDEPILIPSSRIMALDGREVTLTCTLSWEPYGLDTTYCGIAGIGK